MITRRRVPPPDELVADRQGAGVVGGTVVGVEGLAGEGGGLRVGAVASARVGDSGFRE